MSDASFNAVLESWNPTSGAAIATVHSPGGFSIPDAELDDRDELYVCDNSFTSPGIWVFDAGPDAPIIGPIDTGLPPDAWFADVHGSAPYKRHVTFYLAEQIRAELS